MAGDRLTTPGPRRRPDPPRDGARRAAAAPTHVAAARELIREVTGAEPVLWSGSIVGFGTQRYTTADGKEHEWFAVGLAPRKAALTLYGLTYYGSHQGLLTVSAAHRPARAACT